MRVPMNEGEWAKSSGKEIRASAGMALRVTVSIKVASGKEEGRGYPDLPIMGIRGGRKEAWVEWVEDGTVRGHKSPWRVRCTCPLFSPLFHEVMLIAALACLETDRETSDAWRRD